MKQVTTFFEKIFEVLTQRITIFLGHSMAFLIAFFIVILWLGIDFFHASSVHIFINDFIFSFTFLMLFIIQKTQNKFSTVINIKLNELVASHENASNRLIKTEDMTEQELRKLAAHYETLSNHLLKSNDLNTTTSIEQVIEDVKEEVEDDIRKNAEKDIKANGKKVN